MRDRPDDTLSSFPARTAPAISTSAEQSAALDALARTNPIAYDTIRHVAHRWVTTVLHCDRSLVESAMVLPGWVEGRMESTHFLRTHPEIAATLSPDHEILRVVPELAELQADARASSALLARDAEQRARQIRDVLASDAPPPPRDALPARQSFRACIEKLVNGGGATPHALRLPLDVAFDEQLAREPVFDPALLPEYERIITERGGAVWVDECLRHLPTLAPDLCCVRRVVLREYIMRAVGECLVQSERAKERIREEQVAAGRDDGTIAPFERDDESPPLSDIEKLERAAAKLTEDIETSSRASLRRDTE